MGVLEARKDAEKVGYPIVGEEKKDASNVVDYNIREEQTIEQSSAFDANNNTTTGMANVIPGVNAPKLLESTSIYKNVPSKTAYAKFSGGGSETVMQGETKTGLIRPLSIQDQGGAYNYIVGNYFNGYTEITNACIVFPASGIYKITFTYYSTVTDNYRSYDVYLNLDNIYHLQNDSYRSQTGSAYPTETIYINANKGDQLAIYYILKYTSSGGAGIRYDVSSEIIKLS